MRDENQRLHGRDAHAPLAFASHTLSSHFRISEARRERKTDGDGAPSLPFGKGARCARDSASQHRDLKSRSSQYGFVVHIDYLGKSVSSMEK